MGRQPAAGLHADRPGDRRQARRSHRTLALRQGGAKLHRRKYGETIENVANSFYHWMAGNYLKYTARWDTMPVDSHELIALCAPRPVFLSAGNNPGPVNPDGTLPVNDA